jgi:leader peptidase (prepilin peptidase)/N-methyltransferase
MLVLVFILGLIVGSFLNAVIFRLYSGESFLSGRSHCVNCGHTLAAYDLVPLFSFLFLGGKCRYCGKKISIQYPLVEFITGIVFVLVLLHYGLRITDYGFWFQIIMACFLIVIAIFDFKHYLILDKVIFPALGLVVVYNIWQSNFWMGLLSGFGVAGFFLLQYLISKGKWIGFGDVKFGLLLGNLSLWPQSLLVLFLAYMIGAMVGIVLIATGKKDLGSKLPFGVFLSLSAIIVMLAGERIMSWYLNLIGL